MEDDTQLHDSQWPRWLVFKQDDERKRHQAVGSVHAVDAEHALLMGRSVFARRPHIVSLWVTPEEAMVSLTAEELRTGVPVDPAPLSAAVPYQLFRKRGHRRSMAFVEDIGSFVASGPRAAIAMAIEAHPEPDVSVWWAVPRTALSASPADEAAAWFDAAGDKDYKQQSAYGSIGPTTARAEASS